MGWVVGAETFVVIVVALVAIAIAWLVWRRHLLTQRGAAFECYARVSTKTPSSGWVLGVARYTGEYLEWYRLIALSLRPTYRFERSRTQAGAQRDPDVTESIVLFDGQRVLELDQRRGDSTQEMAMSTESLTGLLSWLEAAPPGVGRYGNVAD